MRHPSEWGLGRSRLGRPRPCRNFPIEVVEAKSSVSRVPGLPCLVSQLREWEPILAGICSLVEVPVVLTIRTCDMVSPGALHVTPFKGAVTEDLVQDK